MRVEGEQTKKVLFWKDDVGGFCRVEEFPRSRGLWGKGKIGHFQFPFVARLGLLSFFNSPSLIAFSTEGRSAIYSCFNSMPVTKRESSSSSRICSREGFLRSQRNTPSKAEKQIDRSLLLSPALEPQSSRPIRRASFCQRKTSCSSDRRLSFSGTFATSIPYTFGVPRLEQSRERHLSIKSNQKYIFANSSDSERVVSDSPL